MMRYILIVMLLLVAGCTKEPVSGIVIDNNNFDNVTSLAIEFSPPITITGVDNEIRIN